ncbi:RNA polymerase sigma factor [Bacteroidota bacterium]
MAVVYQDIHKDIIELSKGGDSKSQYQLYQLYSKAMFNICYRMMSSREEAEDMLQEAFSEAFLKLDSFRYESSFGAWLKRIVINKCINEIKRRKAEVLYYDDLKQLDKDDDDFVNYEEIQLDVKKVHKAIEQLPEGYRIIFSLYLLEGYDHTEIAQILGISESTSKSQYMRAKNKIKDLLKSM